LTHNAPTLSRGLSAQPSLADSDKSTDISNSELILFPSDNSVEVTIIPVNVPFTGFNVIADVGVVMA
jgi:hypothetical protein